jgi:DNA-binding MarR family transcriptional regulator
MSQPSSLSTPAFDAVDPRMCVNGKVRKLSRLVASVYDAMLRPHGLQGSQLSILFVIGKLQPVNQKAICERMFMDQSTMSRDVGKLIEKGLVEAVRATDARSTELRLTAEGLRFVERMVPVWQQTHEKVMAVLGSFHVQQLDGIIAALSANLADLKPREATKAPKK